MGLARAYDRGIAIRTIDGLDAGDLDRLLPLRRIEGGIVAE
jgi:hypothetical protein